MKIEGLYGLYHILYLIISLGLTIGGLIIIKKKVYNPSTLKIIFKVAAILLLVAAIINRISTTYYRIYVEKTYSTWWSIFPDSLCSASSFTLAIAVLISSKRNNPIYHFVIYLGVIGAAITAFYPDFLITQKFALVNSWSGLLHHSLMLFLILLIITQGYFTPSIKKFYIAPAGYICFIVFGLFNIQVFNLPNSMNIIKPLISDLKILTSWYMLGIFFSLFVLAVILIYDYYQRHYIHIKVTTKK